ncbi:unnamed protein product [Rodentolepis nana]|uniref:Uncharacterized protein n=1 Tax=Rodentolepis nana TaxID=102285 RepID=A0A0R3TC41_RODNA|nr:unnamed protein product [Rodentolepis nana]
MWNSLNASGVLHAELRHYLKRSDEALDRLYLPSAIVSRMITNSVRDYSEDECSNSSNVAYFVNKWIDYYYY